MPLPLKPPNRVDPLNFPVFAISWFGNPGDGLSLVAYCGGGGSAKTGVNNAVLVRAPTGDTLRIETGEKVGVAIKIVPNPVTRIIWLFVSLGKTVERYHLPSGEKTGEIEVDGDGVNAIAVNAMCDRLACGCENGQVKVYEISDDFFSTEGLLYTCEGHEKSVCALDFSMHGGRLVSSAKDGFARVWKEADCIAELKCSIEGGKKPPPRSKNPQILVRGCAFGNLEGTVVYTVASARRGSAFLARWFQTPEGFECERVEVSEDPISAMNLSGDGGLLALGAVDGTIILWRTDDWKPAKTFKEVHDLPVTCIAARPYDVWLQGEDAGITYHAISASADSRLAHLTTQRRVPKQSKPGDESIFTVLWNWMVVLAIVLLALRPMFTDFQGRCGGVEDFVECLMNEVIIAPATHPGVMSPPY